MDSILKDYSSNSRTDPNTARFDQKTIERYAARLSRAFQRSERRGGKWKLRNVGKPLPVGGKEKRKAAPQRLPGDIAPEYLDPQRKRERIVGEEEEEEAEEVAEEIAELPLDLQELIIIEALYPQKMIHLNQLARGGKETRSRSQFEGVMYVAFRAYWLTFLRMKDVSSFFRILTLSPRFRKKLYKRYMATPPEGLYEQPDFDSVVPVSEFDEKVKIAPHFEIANDEGQSIGLLKPDWYRNFLTTVLYNEWQRAISLSSARAIQFYYWVSQPLADYNNYRPEFLNYWGVRNQEELRKFRESVVGTPPSETVEFRFSKELFPLTWDIDEYRMFGRATGSIVHRPGIQSMPYQSIDQQNMAFEYRWPEGQTTVVPTVWGLVNVFSKSRIELFRVLLFRNGVDISQMNTDGPRPLDTDIIYNSAHVDLQPRGTISHFADYGEYLRLLGALIVDSPYDMSISDRVGSSPSRLAFTPWRDPEPNLLANHIDPKRTSGLGGTLKAMRKTRLRPWVYFRLWSNWAVRSDPLYLPLIIYQPDILPRRPLVTNVIRVEVPE